MAEHINDFENGGRRKNERAVGSPEDKKGSRPTKFELDIQLARAGYPTCRDKSRPRQNGKSSVHPSSKSGSEPVITTRPNQVSQPH